MFISRSTLLIKSSRGTEHDTGTVLCCYLVWFHINLPRLSNAKAIHVEEQ